MTTDAQKKANRRNAQHSTGPTTEAGRERSSLNAMTHGGYATSLEPIPEGRLAENPDTVKDFVEVVLARLRPDDVLEQHQAMRIATLLLRAQRVNRLEWLGLREDDLDRLLDVEQKVTRLDRQTARELKSALADYRETQERRARDPLKRVARLIEQRGAAANAAVEASTSGPVPLDAGTENPEEPTT